MTTTAFHDCSVYVECDIPAGMTIAEWQRQHAVPAPPRRRPSLRQLLHLGR